MNLERTLQFLCVCFALRMPVVGASVSEAYTSRGPSWDSQARLASLYRAVLSQAF